MHLHGHPPLHAQCAHCIRDSCEARSSVHSLAFVCALVHALHQLTAHTTALSDLGAAIAQKIASAQAVLTKHMVVYVHHCVCHLGPPEDVTTCMTHCSRMIVFWDCKCVIFSRFDG